LETGSTALIRNTAADQLADVQKQHPDELFNLLNRVIPFLRSKSWETRTAAARAVGGIVANAEQYDPNAEDAPLNGHVKSEDVVKKEEDDLPPSEDLLDLANLDIASILKFGKVLLGSAGKEYDFKLMAMDPAQRLSHQKKTLAARLGLGGEYIEEDLVTENDITAQTPGLPTPALHRIDTSISQSDSHGAVNCPSPVATPMEEKNGEKGLSKRQLNMLKRKAKKDVQNRASKVQIVDLGPKRSSSQIEYPQTPGSAQPHAIKQEPKQENGDEGVGDYFSLDRKGDDDDTKLVKEFHGAPLPEKPSFQTEGEATGLEWPYDRLCEILTVDLFDHNWETRHGAAMGLREILRIHGAGAGRQKGKSRAQNDALNQRWLNDMACRICCVFMLDRFGDYISDNVVAPIRETAGQTLGAMLQHLSHQNVVSTFKVLFRLVMQTDFGSKPVWQACHGGMIGMRYLVAVRNDLLLKDTELMDGVLTAVMRGLSDFDDDVRAVSAATLVPVAKEFVEMRPQALEGLINRVWECLSNLQDDLSASTGSVMDLLAKLCSFPQVLNAMKENAKHDTQQSFHELVPRLFPFLRHTITSVRAAVLRALLTFLNIEGESSDSWVDSKALRLLFQNILLERNEGVLRLSQQVWDAVVDRLDPITLTHHFAPILDAITTLTLTPIGVPRHPIPMEYHLLIRPSGQVFGPPNHGQQRRSTPPGSLEPSAKKRRKSHFKKDDTPVPASPTHNVDGHMMSGDLELVGVDVMIRSRTCAAQALGKAIAAWPEATRRETFQSRIIPHLRSTHSSSQLTTAIIIEEYARALKTKDALAQVFAEALLPVVEGERPTAYEDLVPKLQVVRTQCTAMLNIFRDGHVSNLPTIAVVVQGQPEASKWAFSLADAEKLLEVQFEKLKKAMTPSQRLISVQSLEAARAEVETSLKDAKEVKEQRDIRIKAAAAGALVALNESPKKPALTIKAMMDSVKKEENAELQKRSAAAVAGLIVHLVGLKRTTIVNKVIGNLVKFYCMETAETPEFHANAGIETGILSLKKEEDIRDHPDAAKFEQEAKAARITRRGAREALEQLVESFGNQVFEQIPILPSLIESPIKAAFSRESLPADILQDGNTFG